MQSCWGQDFAVRTALNRKRKPRNRNHARWPYIAISSRVRCEQKMALHSHLIHDLMHLVNGREVMVASKEGLQRRRANAPGAPCRLLQRVRARRKAGLTNSKTQQIACHLHWHSRTSDYAQPTDEALGRRELRTRTRTRTRTCTRAQMTVQAVVRSRLTPLMSGAAGLCGNAAKASCCLCATRANIAPGSGQGARLSAS